MNASGAVIKAFLASVGFQADERSLKTTLKRVAAFGAVITFTPAPKAAQGEAELARRAELLGTGTEKLRELEYAAAASGVGVEKINAALESLIKKNPRIKDAGQAFDRLARRMAGLSETQRRVYAQRLGIDPGLIPLLTSDLGKLRAEFQAMYAVAGVDGREAAEASKEFTAEMGKMVFLGKLLAKSVALPFIVKLRGRLVELRKAVLENYQRIRNAVEAAISLALRVSGAVSRAVSRVIGLLSRLAGWFDSLGAAQKKAVGGIGMLTAAWRLLSLNFLRTPLGMILTGLAALLLLLEDYQTWKEGGKSYIDWGPWAATVETLIKSVRTALPYIAAIIVLSRRARILSMLTKVQGALLFIPGLIGDIVRAFRLLGLAAAANPVGALVVALAAAAFLVMENWESVKKGMSIFWEWLSGKAEKAAAIIGDKLGALKGIWDDILAWFRKKFESCLDLLPDVAKKALGIEIKTEASETAREAAIDAEQEIYGIRRPAPPDDPPRAGPFAALWDAAGNFEAWQRQMALPALAPSPATRAALSSSVDNSRAVSLSAETHIHVQSSDPQAAGRAVAREQSRVNADLARAMRNNAR